MPRSVRTRKVRRCLQASSARTCLTAVPHEDGGPRSARTHGVLRHEDQRELPRQPRPLRAADDPGRDHPLHDATDGALLALLDSIEITTLRTPRRLPSRAIPRTRRCARGHRSRMRRSRAAASSLALRRCGRIERVCAWTWIPRRRALRGRDGERRSASTCSPSSTYRAAMRASDIVVTCTPSRRPLLGRGGCADRDASSPTLFSLSLRTGIHS